jgi:hypothetical protein
MEDFKMKIKEDFDRFGKEVTRSKTRMHEK